MYVSWPPGQSTRSSWNLSSSTGQLVRDVGDRSSALTYHLVAPPQQSKEEIRAMEAEATFTIQQVAATAVMLYLCTLYRNRSRSSRG